MNNPARRSRVSPAEALALLGIITIVAWPAWLRGGTVPALMAPLPWLALVLLTVWVLGSRRSQTSEHDADALQPWRDPVVWASVVLLALLAVQWWNAGRELMLDPLTQTWAYGPPRVAWLPSAVTTGDAREMWQWFLPAAVLLVLVRHGLRQRRAFTVLCGVVLANATLLALVGIGQYATKSHKLYGEAAPAAHFFASFGYANHAGEFFLLVLSLAAGVALWGVSTGGARSRRVTVAATVAAWVCLAAVHLSLSRASILLAWGLCAIVLYILFRAYYARMSPSSRFSVGLVGFAVVALMFFVISGLARGAVRAEIASLTPGHVARSLTTGRWFQVDSALRMWRDQPVAGVGGWGYRYLAALYIAPDDWSRITHDGEDATISANVHNDPAQFLAEFGAVGAMAMLVAVMAMALPLARNANRKNPLLLLVTIGLGMTFAQSLVDLPFRSPAVLYAWLLLLAAGGKLVESAPAAYGESLRDKARP